MNIIRNITYSYQTKAYSEPCETSMELLKTSKMGSEYDSGYSLSPS